MLLTPTTAIFGLKSPGFKADFVSSGCSPFVLHMRISAGIGKMRLSTITDRRQGIFDKIMEMIPQPLTYEDMNEIEAPLIHEENWRTDQ